MTYAVGDLDNVKHQVVSILNAHPGVWSAAVQTNPSIGAFPSDAELLLAILQADEYICTYGYFNSANDALASPFNVTLEPLGNGDRLPFFHGTLNRVDVSKAVASLTQASINTTTDIITYPNHGMVTGDVVSFQLLSGALPTCGSPTFAVLTNYYVIKVTDNTFQLARTLGDAISDTWIDILTAPTGTYQLIDWVTGIEAKSIDDVINAVQVGNAYVGAGSFDFLYKIDTGSIYTPATYCRLTVPEYIRTSTLQTRQSEEFLVTATAVKLLTKNASPAPFQIYAAEADRGLQEIIRDGQYTLMASKAEGGN